MNVAAYHTAVRSFRCTLKVENDHRALCCLGCALGCGSEELFMGDVEVLSVKVDQSPATFRGFGNRCTHHSIYVHLNY